MEVFVRNKGRVSLGKSDFITSGGEGSIYAKGDTAYKIYLDRNKVISEAKVGELSILTDKNIIKPENMILNGRNKPIGYTMRYVTNTIALCHMFTKGFKQRNSIDTKDVLYLVNQMRDIITKIHNNKILIVDVNELNFLVSSRFKNIYFIDVDSYQTPSYPATAIMDSIRDRHCGGKFSENTDWFSFGIITFQMFVGIHPYKGKHKTYKALDDRMTNNVSVFNKEVSTPGAMLPLKTIPKQYLSWYKSIFEDGKRVPPPFGDEFVVAKLVSRKITVTGTDNFIIEEIGDFGADIISYGYICQNQIVMTTDGMYLNGKRDSRVDGASAVCVTPKLGHVFAVSIDGSRLRLYDVSNGKESEFNTVATSLAPIGGRIYLKASTSIRELVFSETTDRIIPSVKEVSNILPKATEIHDGVIIQNLLGTYYMSIYPEQGRHYQIKVGELSGHRVIDAKYENRIAMMIVESGGKYSRLTIKVSEDYRSYSSREENNVGLAPINFTVLDNGICISINENGHAVIFTNKASDNRVKEIQDTTLEGSRLYHKGITTMFSRDSTLYSVKMK